MSLARAVRQLRGYELGADTPDEAEQLGTVYDELLAAGHTPGAALELTLGYRQWRRRSGRRLPPLTPAGWLRAFWRLRRRSGR